MSLRPSESFDATTRGGSASALTGRVVRCPRCRREFETMRRFQMACPECGHAWDEASVTAYRNSFEARLADLREKGIAALVLAVMALVSAGFVAFLIYLLAAPAVRGALGDGLTLVFFLTAVLALLVTSVAILRIPAARLTPRQLYNVVKSRLRWTE